MLEFIYTNNVENLGVSADKLIGAAQKYELPRLKAMCEDALSKALKPQNAADFLKLAELYEAPTLLDRVINFIAVHFSVVSKCRNYNDIKCPILLKRIALAIAERRC
uniref:BTB domain-containing protein n=1 Tax=Bracon brevicornis TaxID=1563983 RepID=A0A6V7J3P5_9HYME